jgi:hypothetical protein
MTFDYAGACRSGPVKPDEGISGGAVFLIMYIKKLVMF